MAHSHILMSIRSDIRKVLQMCEMEMDMKGKREDDSQSLLLDLNLALLEHEGRPNDSLPDILDVFNDCLEVGCCVIRSSDEDVVRAAICRGGIH